MRTSASCLQQGAVSVLTPQSQASVDPAKGFIVQSRGRWWETGGRLQSPLVDLEAGWKEKQEACL